MVCGAPYPDTVELSAEDAAAHEAAQAAFAALSEQYESAEELPGEIDERFGELEAEIERLEAKRQAYDPEVVARSGVFVILNHDGSLRIERGFVRQEDEPSKDSSVGEDIGVGARADTVPGNDDGCPHSASDDETATGKPLSDALLRDLTAHRTLALRLALGEQPDVALIATIHAMVAQTFYHQDTSCLDIRPNSVALAGHAEGIEDTAAAKALADRHDRWAAQLPKSPSDLWGFVVALDYDSRMALFAHCAALSVFAVKVPWEKKPSAWATADTLATIVGLDMTAHWSPTVRSYFGRVTKDGIMSAVRETVGAEAAERIAGMKKDAMAAIAEQLLAGTGWLPEVLRTSTAGDIPDGETSRSGGTLADEGAYRVAAE
jgi:ParB family chromosome partitioning protein